MHLSVVTPFGREANVSNIEIIEYLARQLNEVTAERNAAIADLDEVSRGDADICRFCKGCRGDETLGCTGFEWRGIKK